MGKRNNAGGCDAAGCDNAARPGRKYCGSCDARISAAGSELSRAARGASGRDGDALDLFAPPSDPAPSAPAKLNLLRRPDLDRPGAPPAYESIDDATAQRIKREGRDTRPRSRMPESTTDLAPYARGSATSEAAARRVGESGAARSQMGRIYAHIVAQGARGATRQELVDALGLLWQSVGGRVRRLYQQGCIGSNGHTRPSTLTGNPQEILVHEGLVERWQPDQARPADWRGVTTDGREPHPPAPAPKDAAP